MGRNIKCKPNNLFIKTLSETKPFMKANFIAAFLFGIWHMVMPIRSYMNGEISFAGNIWAGLGDHLFNNTVATNMLYVITRKGADELQIVRIMAAQIISFAFVLVIHCYKNRKGNYTIPNDFKK